MSQVNVGLGGTQTIDQSGTDSVAFQGIGTLNIAGNPANPIDVTLSQVGGVGVLDTVDITDANVLLDGVAGVSALANYNIGSGGRLTFGNTADVTAGTTIGFTAPDSRLALGNGVDLTALSGIAGFAPGSTIDVGTPASSFTYTDNAGTGTGGTLTLLDSNGLPVASLPLLTGDYAANDFQLSPDGKGGTVLSFDMTTPTVTSVRTSPSSGNLGAGQTATIDVGLSEGATVTGGTPTLTLSDGGTATYDPTASTPTDLVFTHTVQGGETAPDLGVLGANLNGAYIADQAGHVADLSGAIINPPGTLSVGTDGVYRFFDTSTGTHFFTADATEKDALTNPNSPDYRPDLKEETNTFGAIDPGATDPSEVTVYRFFDTVHGTHFFTASQAEASGLQNPTSSTYRPDLVAEPNASFKEDATQQPGDVPVYRFFDSTYGTHFYTGGQAEYNAITTPGTASYRPDLVSEGIGFYAPSGTYT